jgi:uncharacterized membrane protein
VQQQLFPFLLFLHIGGAIMAFGPTLAFPLIQAMGAREREHSEFATRVTKAIAERYTVPVGIFVALTGLTLVWASGRSLTQLWILLAIVAYVATLLFALFVQAPTVNRILEIVGAMRAGGAPEAAGATAAAMAQPAGGPPPEASFPQTMVRPAGPPPELAALIGRARMGGLFMAAALVFILAMMVFKPGA